MNNLRGEIDRDGWALQYVLATDPSRSYGYTVGLTLRDLPEVVVTGLPPAVSWDVLNDVADAVTVGKAPRPGDTIPCPGTDALLSVEEVDDVEHLTRVRELVGPSARVVALNLRPCPPSALGASRDGAGAGLAVDR